MKKYFNRQYVTAEDLEPWRVRFNGAVMFLDTIGTKQAPPGLRFDFTRG